MGGWIAHIRQVVADNPVSIIAGVVLLAIIFAAIFGPWLTPYDPYLTDTDAIYQSPGARYWFGTDQLGRDIFSRVLVAARLDLFIAITSVACSCLLGTIIGGISGLLGGITDRIVGRFVDILMAFPLFVLALALVAVLGNRIENVILATAVINLPFYIRLSRAEVLSQRHLSYIDAAYVSGNSQARTLLTFLLPNSLPALVVQVSLNMGWAILNTAGLSFVGLGIRPPTAEWGVMVSLGAKDMISGYWWTGLFPGLALTLTVLCFNLVGDSLRDAVDPRTRA